ncbi:MAG TPA: YbaK/EbsC family protein [Gammaproteobacteria bacterium]|nr:YbaK/EbsC family protein [Gammaproteobacteria bacterium]
MAIAGTVRGYIEGRGVAYQPLSHPATGSAHESAEAAHVLEDHIAKAVILHDRYGEVMAVVPGDAWVRLHAVNAALGRELVLASETDAARHFPDCEPGALPPLGPAYGLETLVDEAVTTLAFVFVEAGDHQTLLKMGTEEYLSLLDGARRGHFSHKE